MHRTAACLAYRTLNWPYTLIRLAYTSRAFPEDMSKASANSLTHSHLHIVPSFYVELSYPKPRVSLSTFKLLLLYSSKHVAANYSLCNLGDVHYLLLVCMQFPRIISTSCPRITHLRCAECLQWLMVCCKWISLSGGFTSSFCQNFSDLEMKAFTILHSPTSPLATSLISILLNNALCLCKIISPGSLAVMTILNPVVKKMQLVL